MERAKILRTLAVIGNALAVCFLIFLALNAPILFHTTPGSASVPRMPSKPPASERPRVLLIVLDGLRADTASDARTMPHLQRLAARGTRGIARVESLIPSTICGIRAMVESVRLAPAAFVFDFVAPPAPQGGWLAAVSESGGRTFVVGPRLWTDLYGKWISTAVTSAELTGEDERLLKAALDLVRAPDWRLGVIHFSHPDVAAHLHGGRSSRYASAAAWCDRALSQLAAAADPMTTIMVTSDHGVTDSGGHAGPEPDVVQVPVIATGPHAPVIPSSMRQVEIASLLRSACGPGTEMNENRNHPDFSPDVSKSIASRAGALWRVALAFVAAVATLRLLSLSMELGADSRTATWLHGAVWAGGILIMFLPAALAMGGIALLLWLTPTRPGLPVPTMLLCAALGAIIGMLRVWYSITPLPTFPDSAPEGFSLHAGCLAAALMGAGFAFLSQGRAGDSTGANSGPTSLLAGVAVLFAETVLAPGVQTVSLSAIDVQSAFHLVIEGWGIPVAATVAALQSLLPELLALGCFAVAVPAAGGRLFVAIALGAGAVHVGQAFVATAGLSITWPSSISQLTASSLSLALLLRTGGAVSLVFPLIAVVVWVRRPRFLTARQSSCSMTR
ncbi:MAG: alkaline phosphatase family protein [Verrucomicrobiota bacterium]